MAADSLPYFRLLLLPPTPLLKTLKQLGSTSISFNGKKLLGSSLPFV